MTHCCLSSRRNTRDGSKEEVTYDACHVLLATGRKPNTKNLGLEDVSAHAPCLSVCQSIWLSVGRSDSVVVCPSITKNLGLDDVSAHVPCPSVAQSVGRTVRQTVSRIAEPGYERCDPRVVCQPHAWSDNQTDSIQCIHLTSVSGFLSVSRSACRSDQWCVHLTRT